MPENFTQKDIVNRGQLLAEYNDAMYVNEDGELILPSSSVGSDRKPIGGHCLCFNNSNPDAYIQTSIPSSLRDTYRIVIKGEGDLANYRALYIDDTDSNITIKQVPNATSTDVFYLSYIAFVNIESGKLEHLFECEEGSGILLYDACTGDTATLESVTSISALRVSKRVKEWIQDENNLDSTYKIHGTQGYAYGSTATNFQDIPFPISMAFRFRCNQTYATPVASENLIYWGTGNGTGVTYGIKLAGLQSSSSNLVVAYLNNSSPSSTNQIVIANQRSVLCNGQWHTIVVCVNSTQLKVYIDGVLKGTLNSTFTAISSPPTLLNLRIASTQYNNTYNKNWDVNSLTIVNFDMSDASSPYTIEDYNNRKDLPTNVLLGVEDNKAWLCWQNNTTNRIWDSTPNKKHMNSATQIYANACIPDKCYGTFFNNVGGNIVDGVVIPRKVLV